MAYNPLVAYVAKMPRKRGATIHIEETHIDGVHLVNMNDVHLVDDIEHYDCSVCLKVHIEIVHPSGKVDTYDRPRR